MRIIVVKVFGEIREYDLTTSIQQIERLKLHAKDFEIIEYKEDTCKK